MGEESNLIIIEKAISDIDSVMAFWRKNKTTSDRGENLGHERRKPK